jgi:DNA-binding SARP family transcriptional activator
MLALKAFGTLDVRSDGGAPLTSLLAQSKRAALFTYLVLSRPGEMHRRDALLSLFWPELDQAHGRNALSQSLSFLRRELGHGVLVTRGAEEVGIDAAEITSDVRTFAEALAAEDWAGAVEAYGGDLLEGLHVVGAAPFTDWVDRERERLREAASGAAWKLAHAKIAAGGLTEAERAGQRALDLVATDESPVRASIEALAGAGDRAAAVDFFERFRTRLREELELEPAPETVAVFGTWSGPSSRRAVGGSAVSTTTSISCV